MCWLLLSSVAKKRSRTQNKSQKNQNIGKLAPHILNLCGPSHTHLTSSRLGLTPDMVEEIKENPEFSEVYRLHNYVQSIKKKHNEVRQQA